MGTIMVRCKDAGLGRGGAGEAVVQRRAPLAECGEGTIGGGVRGVSDQGGVHSSSQE